MSDNSQTFYHWLVGYLDGCDPIDLVVRSGCPPREYEPEAEAILRALPRIQDHEDAAAAIHKVFLHFFGAGDGLAGGVERYQDMGVTIFQAWKQRETGLFSERDLTEISRQD
ncbi:MAG TPA: hypothetical protein VGK84_10580 [Candidatus Tumulicola sp.]|jgi:hypothetical protein